MNQNLEKIRPLLQHLSHEAVAYLFPYLFPKDSYWTGDFRDRDPLLLREIPSQTAETDKPYRHPSNKRSIPNVPDADSVPEAFLDETEYLARRDAFIEQEILEEEERGQRIRAAIERFLEENHTTREELRNLLDAPVTYSRLRITRTGNILLTDYDNREVKMNTLSKVIFIFYLRHPEGVAFSELWDHKEEMLFIYGKLTHRLDNCAIEKSIESLCNTVENNSIHEKLSIVKRAFINAVDEDIAKMYYIKGPAGGIRRIELSRDLIRIDLLL